MAMNTPEELTRLTRLVEMRGLILEAEMLRVDLDGLFDTCPRSLVGRVQARDKVNARIDRRQWKARRIAWGLPVVNTDAVLAFLRENVGFVGADRPDVLTLGKAATVAFDLFDSGGQVPSWVWSLTKDVCYAYSDGRLLGRP